MCSKGCCFVAFRGSGVKLDVESAALVRERFWEALGSGLSPTAAATVAGVCGATGRKWARAAGYQTNPKHCGTRYSQVKGAFWAALRSGMTPTQAAVVVGVSENAGREWVAQAGYVPRTPFPAGLELVAPSRGSSLSFLERCRLEELLEAGRSQASAARLLGRDRSTISRETRRGATRSGYRARVGQDAVDVARACPKPRKLETNPALLTERALAAGSTPGPARACAQAALSSSAMIAARSCAV